MNIVVIGLGVGDTACLVAAARNALVNCSIVVGSSRQLKMVETLVQGIECCALPKLDQLQQQLDEWQKNGVENIAILASGDPLYFGIGTWLVRHWPMQNIEFFPAVSSIQAACSALGLTLQTARVISLHGRPKTTLRRALQPNQTLLILTDKHSSPQYIAQECVKAGFPSAQIMVCQKLGSSQQEIHRESAQTLSESQESFHPLHVTVVQLAEPDSAIAEVCQPVFPGIPDQVFVTGANDGSGMITKREVRLAILSYLQLSAQEVIWDIGAGCGSVSIELAYWQPQAQIYSVESNQDRLDKLLENQQRFGVVDNLHPLLGHAPECLAELPDPHKVFIGGSDGQLEEVFAEAWRRLPVGGILLISAVTENTKQQLWYLQQQYGVEAEFDSVQMAVSRLGSLGSQWVYRPQLPVTLCYWRKVFAAHCHERQISE